jgi:hypothetical protein
LFSAWNYEATKVEKEMTLGILCGILFFNKSGAG